MDRGAESAHTRNHLRQRIGNGILVEEKVMNTLNGIRNLSVAALATGALLASAAFAGSASDDVGVADLGHITVLARRDAPVEDLGSLVVSASRLAPSFADLGTLTVTATRIETVALASPASRRVWK
jgi:hypothetical protein